MSQTSKGPAPWGIWSSNGTASSAHTKMTSQNSTANGATGTISSKQKHKEPWNPALPTPPTSAPAATNTIIPQGLGFDGATSVTDTQDEVLSSSPQNGRRGNSPDIVRSNSPFLYRQRQATAAQAAALHHSPKDAFNESRNTYGFADENAGRHPSQRLKNVLQSAIEDDGYPSNLTGPARSSSTPPFANAHPGQNFTPNTNAPFFTPQVPQRGFYEGSREPDIGATLRNLSISDSVTSRFESAGSRTNSPYIHNGMPGSPFMHQQQHQPQPDYSQYSDYSSGYNRSQYEDEYARLSPSGYPPQEPVYGNYAYGYRGSSMRDVYRGNDMNRGGYDRNRFAQDRRPMPFASNDYYRGPQANSYQQNSPYYENRGAPSPYASPAPRREDTGAGLRSPMLEEFRNNKAKKYEIRDIVGHVVEFSGDQHGSRFIQQKLETANSDDKEEIFQEMLPNCLQLMTDVFGNYVIQKFFEHGNQVQKTILAKHMETHVLSLSLQMYGCRVVQKALEHILAEQQVHMVRELDGFVLKCVKDQNGNHVIQKALERVPAEKIQFIITAFHGQAYSLATHPYGCRVIQRMLEYCPEAQVTLLEELHRYTQNLIVDQYGNYVSQHIIERGNPADRSKVIDIVRGQVLALSKHKFASNVVEKCIAFGSQAERHDLIEEALVPGTDGQSGISSLMKDQYGNYVLQKMLEVGDDTQRIELAQKIKPLLETLKKFSYGKHLASIERLLELQA